MGASITLAGESLISQKQSKREALLVSKFVLANVPGLDTTLPVDRSAGVPQSDQIVHSVPVTREGYLATNKVVYSLMLGSDVGDFDFNWIGLVSAEDVLVIAAYVPRQQKRREIPPLQAGNNLTRNIILEYDGAQSLTGINVPASSWQFDFTADFTAINTKIDLLQVEIAKKVDLENWTPPAAVSLDGPVLVYPGSTNTYKITDYNRFSVFTASTTLGTVSVAADVVTLVVPTVAAAGLLTLDVLRDGNKASFKLPIGSASIVPPSITSPSNLATGVTLDPVLVSTPFAVYPAGYDVHKSSQWQIATDEAFTAVVFDRTSTTALETIKLSDFDIRLTPGKRFYGRVKHNGNTLSSDWLTATIFNTATTYIRQPAITFPTDGQVNVSPYAVLLGDAFSVYGGADTHIESRWQYSSVPDFSTVMIDSGWITSQLTSYKPAIEIPQKTVVYVRSKYKGQTLGETQWSLGVKFTTAAQLQGTYTKLPAGATIRMGHIGVEYNGKMFIQGGGDSSNNLLDTFWSYDPTAKSWSQEPSGMPRTGHAAGVIGGFLYIAGGTDNTSNSGGTASAYRYNFQTKAWSQIASMPYRLSHTRGAVVDGKFYVFAGIPDNAGDATYVLCCYDPATNAWTVKANGPNRYDHGMTAYGGKIYVAGGFFGNNGGSGGITGGWLNTLYCYDPATNTWSQLASIPFADPEGKGRWQGTLTAISGKLYWFGGGYYVNSYYRDLWVYDISNNAWAKVTDGAAAMGGRQGHSAVVMSGKILIYAGNGNRNDLWQIE